MSERRGAKGASVPLCEPRPSALPAEALLAEPRR